MSGYIVETKKGKKGYTLRKDLPLNGRKVKVYIGQPGGEIEEKLLCNSDELKVFGFWD